MAIELTQNITQNNLSTQTVIPSGIATSIERMIVLEVDAAKDKRAFTNVPDAQYVHSLMQKGVPVRFCIRINYESGNKFIYYPTCVKANYITVYDRTGGMEIYLNDDGTFTRSGTALW